MNKRWLERAKETYKFHRAHIILNEDWRMINTARALKRSLGSVCEDLKIASFLKTHETEINRFDHAYQAIEFIRKKQKEIDLRELE